MNNSSDEGNPNHACCTMNAFYLISGKWHPTDWACAVSKWVVGTVVQQGLADNNTPAVTNQALGLPFTPLANGSRGRYRKNDLFKSHLFLPPPRPHQGVKSKTIVNNHIPAWRMYDLIGLMTPAHRIAYTDNCGKSPTQ